MEQVVQSRLLRVFVALVFVLAAVKAGVDVTHCGHVGKGTGHTTHKGGANDCR